jgi:Family of unknown function (DUF6941)
MPQPRRRRPGLLPAAQVEYLVLADAVEALNGKLYMMGGGWDTMFVRDLTPPVALSFACGVEVPWNVTDDDHTLTVAIRDPDGAEVAPPLSITFRTGRPPTLERAASMHVPFAVKGEFRFPAFGPYTITGAVDGAPGRTFPFFIKPGQPQPQPQPAR